jgi:D-aminopeptidase
MTGGAVRLRIDDKQLDALFAQLNQCNVPGIAVGVGVKGRAVYRKGFGLATMELPVVLSPSMRMRIFSITKHFTCLLYLLLCEDGKADIDDCIGQYLATIHPVTRKATVRQLMTHTSGLRDALGIRWLFSGYEQNVSSAEVLKLYEDIDDINFPAGARRAYNNGGYMMLSAAIERIADCPLKDALQHRIFEPVGMYDTLLRLVDTDFVSNSAIMHMTKENGEYVKSYLGGELTGEGGIVSTVDDMLRWLAHMDAPMVGTSKTWELMKTPQRLANGTSTGYGLGLSLARYRGIEAVWHAGGGLGGNSQFIKVPAVGLDVVILANRQDVSSMELGEKVLDACLVGLDPIDEGVREEIATGTFKARISGRVLKLFKKDNAQFIQWNGEESRARPGENGGLRPVGGLISPNNMSFFVQGDWSQPDAVLFRSFGEDEELIPVGTASPTEPQAIAGVYRSESTGTDVIIEPGGHDMLMKTRGRFGTSVYPLECLGERVWRASKNAGVMVLSFDDAASAFRVTGDTNWGLTFSRVGGSGL